MVGSDWNLKPGWRKEAWSDLSGSHNKCAPIPLMYVMLYQNTAPWINTAPTAPAMDRGSLPSSVTRTKGLWDSWPSVLARASRGWLLPRRWSGVMFSPADPRDRCAGRPQQHTLAGFPGSRPAEPRHTKTARASSSLLSSPPSSPQSCFLLYFLT